jgi:hypothetical protein
MIESALEENASKCLAQQGAAAKLGVPRCKLESKIGSLKIDKNRFKI